MLLEIILIEHAINTKLSIKGICVILEFFSYLCNATGRKKSLEQKGSSSKRENLDNFLHQMDDSGLICLDAIRGVEAYRQDVYCSKHRPEALVR